ncbi:MAG: hypothetical protein WC497_01755 [Patescibacteria group bacterium]
MSPAKSRVSYRTDLSKLLRAANVDLGWLYARIDADAQGRIAARLSHPAFSQPEELSQNGYPAEHVAQAERTAEIILQESARYIISLFDETKRTWVEKPATEGLHEAEESSDQTSARPQTNSSQQQLGNVA